MVTIMSVSRRHGSSCTMRKCRCHATARWGLSWLYRALVHLMGQKRQEGMDWGFSPLARLHPAGQTLTLHGSGKSSRIPPTRVRSRRQDPTGELLFQFILPKHENKRSQRLGTALVVGFTTTGSMAWEATSVCRGSTMSTGSRRWSTLAAPLLDRPRMHRTPSKILRADRADSVRSWHMP